MKRVKHVSDDDDDDDDDDELKFMRHLLFRVMNICKVKAK